jgi:hypothetical protein
MIFALQLQIPFGTVARRDTAITELQDQITTRSRWGAELIRGFTVEDTGDPAVLADLRFVSEGDNDAIEQWLRNRLTGVRTPRNGAWIQVHRCNHDEDNTPCVIQRRFEVVNGSWTRTI